MTSRKVSLPELGWRGRVFARTTFDRLHHCCATSRWRRGHLAWALAPLPGLAPARAAVNVGRWKDAHRELTEYFASAPQRFAIAATTKASLTPRLRQRVPDVTANAAASGDRLLAGEYDLLGYPRLRFARDGGIDWHADPVHGRLAPRAFWSSVRYLDPACGDHKIIWELNRHQHWLALGRAFWLTGDVKYRSRCLWELENWLEANPPLVGINWASMLELALRSISWIWALHLFVDPAATDDEPWMIDLLVGLDRQLTQIERNLSKYFSPNTHLLGEALALYVAGRSLPEFRASPRREAIGRRLLVDEIGRQLCADGGHYERSTHYHRYALDFYLLALVVATVTDDPVAERFEDAVARLARAARLLADDRGHLSGFGDDDGGMLLPIAGRQRADISDSLGTAAVLLNRPELHVGPIAEEACWLLAHPSLAARLEATPAAAPIHAIASEALPESGYYVSRSIAGDHLVIDGGPEEYRHAGHAHADALAITLTVRGTPMLIDTGTGCYSIDTNLRDRFRSATMHNTLVIDDRPQAVPGGPFGWKRIARAHARRWRAHAAFDYFEGTHDGFHPIEHRRHLFSLPGDLLVAADLVRGTGSHLAATHWHIDPRWAVAVDHRHVTLSIGEASCQLVTLAGRVERFDADRETGLGWHAPAYGRIEPSTTIRVTHRAMAPFWMIHILGLDPDNPVLEIHNVPIWAEAGVLRHATGVRVTRQTSSDLIVIAEPAKAGLKATWRTSEIESDAHLLFCRTTASGQAERIAMVDGSIAHVAGARPLSLERPHVVPAAHLDVRTFDTDVVTGT